MALQNKYAALQPLLHIHVVRQLVEEVGNEGAVGVVGHDKESDRLGHEELLLAQPFHAVERAASNLTLLLGEGMWHEVNKVAHPAVCISQKFTSVSNFGYLVVLGYVLNFDF